MLRFAAVGIDHGHIFDHVRGLRAAGAECVGFDPQTTDPAVLDGFRTQFPDIPEASRERLLDDTSIDVICTAAIPRDRGPIAIEAMKRGKDVMVDKPGCVSLAQLDDIRRTVQETGRIFSVCFSERLCVPAAVLAGKLVGDGAIGDVVQTVGLGPHRINRPARPVVVLRAGGHWRHHQRHRVAPGRPVPVLHRFEPCRRGRQHRRQFR